MKRTIGIIALVAAIALLALPKLLDARKGATAAVVASADTLTVEGRLVVPRALEDRIYTTGTMRANESVELVSEASGKVTGIFFDEGRSVQAGALLVKINDADLQAQLERARVRLSLAERREARQRQLLERGSISQEEYDLVQNEMQVISAELRVIEAQIERTEVRAPFDGVVGLRYVSAGSFISPQTRIGTLQNLNPIKIDFSIPEKYVGRVRSGDEIVYSVAGSDQKFRGTIYAIEPGVRQDTRSIQIRAISRNPGAEIMPGAFADVELLIERIDDALTVPSISIVPELQGKKVFLYRDGKIQPQIVETGIRTESVVQVVQGLAAGDTVVVSGLQMIRPGQAVKIAHLER